MTGANQAAITKVSPRASRTDLGRPKGAFVGSFSEVADTGSYAASRSSRRTAPGRRDDADTLDASSCCPATVSGT
jgi:hypothetical protein